jgi:hypothetical protein
MDDSQDRPFEACQRLFEAAIGRRSAAILIHRWTYLGTITCAWIGAATPRQQIQCK